ncbi:arylsulfatase [Ancylomarina sp. 16SWW S1-10-2]|uniref:arylsulfatase n=1 Tax=Ancylomarina sp. 16SWW S1-10-2 TaxID=2499681 RepID=UPI0012AE26AB|nr:arylsulfatase [Ancylomarina sp. 16SWW S1-10-2]MRT91995.1 arylsulfatase [Ancylomarina sp. 16SWW S1-10-2]
MNKLVFLLIAVLSLSSCNEKKEKKEKKNQKPNIVYILADDLGYGDLSCYGQDKFETPNIDKLAKRGMKFTQHYSGAAVCAPSRSTLLTGKHTGHTSIRGNKELDGEGQLPMKGSSITVAELLKTAGYTTGAFGKWGLGFPGSEGDANNQGFDEFYGYNCQRMAHRYYPAYLRHNQDKEYLEGNDWTNTVTYAPDKIQDATLQFIENNKDTSFFAYVPLVLPHAELISPNDSIMEMFEGKFDEVPYVGVKGSDYGPDMIQSKFCSQKTPYAAFAAMVTRMDNYVGQITAKLEELGIADNTIVMFASDNGPHAAGGANPVYFNSAGGLRGIKRDLYEGGIRAPFIAVWPNKIEAGSVSDHVSAFWDFLPTCAAIAGVKSVEGIDGISFLPELLGEANQEEHDHLYWEFSRKGGRQAVRMGDWKAVIYKLHKQGELELYNLATDVSESNNVADQHPDIVAKMKEIMKKEHVDSKRFPL